MGKVYLIGVGPGDEELVNLKAVNSIEKCDVLLYDRLANSSILRYAKDDCRIYYCGKAPGSHYKTQSEINEMLIKFSKEGNTVGRIKGGDPYVFGRGGEEALALVKEGIEFETVSGVTSPVAVLNYAGIPMTHRGLTQSFHVFTAMTEDKLNIDWGAVVKLEGTLVFMMGLKNLGLIMNSLFNAGKSKDTPCGVVMKGTTSKQRKVTGTIGDIEEKVLKAGLKSPCIIVVGEVVGLNEELDWYSKKELFGLNVCITRSKRQSADIREKLLSLGAEVTEINSIETSPIDGSLDGYIEKLSDYDYVVLTSVNGVEYFFEELVKREYDIRNIRAKFPAIGRKTADVLKQRGIVPSLVPRTFVLEGLYDELKGEVGFGDKVLIAKSESGRDYLADKLREDGASVDVVNLYKTTKGRLKGYENLEDVDIIIFTSPSTVRNTIELFGKDSVSKKTIVSIGPITEKELVSQGIQSHVSSDHSIDGIVSKLIEIKKAVK